MCPEECETGTDKRQSGYDRWKRDGEGNKREIVVSGSERMEPAACRETLHSMAFGPQLGVGRRVWGKRVQVIRFNIRCTLRRGCGPTSVSNHLRKVDRGRSASDGNKKGVKVSGSQLNVPECSR